MAGLLSGPGSLHQDRRAGTLTLATTNTFSGNTLISGGTLALGSPLALQNSTLDTSGSGTLSFGSLTAATLGGLTGPGTLGLANTVSTAVALSVGNNNASTTYSGMLEGAGSLNKIGSGTLVLTGSNTYTGPTTINQGKLVVDGWLTNSAVTVNSGGILSGTGSLASVTVNSGGHSGPGRFAGRLGPQRQLDLGIGSGDGLSTRYAFDRADEVLMPSGQLTLNGQQFADFNFTPPASFGPGSYDLIDAGSISGSLGTSTSGTIDGLPATLAVQRGSNDLVLNVTPEPSYAHAAGRRRHRSCRLRLAAAKSSEERLNENHKTTPRQSCHFLRGNRIATKRHGGPLDPPRRAVSEPSPCLPARQRSSHRARQSQKGSSCSGCKGRETCVVVPPLGGIPPIDLQESNAISTRWPICWFSQIRVSGNLGRL